MKLKDKVAVITGAQRGFGKAIALALAREGATIVAVDMGKDIEGTASEIKQMGQKAIGLIADITSPEQIKNMVNTAIEVFGRIDILVNNAGILPKRSFLWEADDNDWRKTIEVNLIGTYNMTKAVLPLIIKNGKGRVINLSSVSGKNGSPTSSAYCASKHGIVGITRTLAMELSLLGLTEITVNAICPGVGNTEMVTEKGGLLDEVARITGTTREIVLTKQLPQVSLLKRLIEPDEIADMVVYLASDAARGITGQAINVCGGTAFY
ncbi:MAG: SDR family NAD(P)-dependent oxidoreductase [Smithella sp.]|jgi:NAD(P)-dependent dehydrogenase (short-subunit alcohol dehydrogenase family)